jgi:nitrate reductase gamma subunit
VNVTAVILGVVVPYGAVFLFVAGFLWRIISWARLPVPFHIPTVCGQQTSLPWIRSHFTESPSTGWGVVARMAKEVLLFRSLFRNDRAVLDGGRLGYCGSRLLWAGSLLFHWCLLWILLRHLRLFLEPVPGFVVSIQALDGLFQVGVPPFFTTDAAITAALLYLLLRRLMDRQVRAISLPADYFALLLLLGIVVSGILMRHVFKVDLLEVKRFTLGLVTFHPVVPAGLGLVFYMHLLLVSALLAYFPFSKLMHMGGVFFSPTRNLRNDSRMVRHVNPWSYPVKVHTYAEWEDDFREAMKAEGMPVEKE